MLVEGCSRGTRYLMSKCTALCLMWCRLREAALVRGWCAPSAAWNTCAHHAYTQTQLTGPGNHIPQWCLNECTKGRFVN
eukprot:1136490-Pelagomonas_calceolata.AAC.7